MAAELTEKIVVLISPEQKATAQEKAKELGGMGALVREALTLFLASDVSTSKQTASNMTAPN